MKVWRILFELIKELDTCMRIHLIRGILDRYVIPPKDNWRHFDEEEYYHMIHIEGLLDDYNDDPEAIEIKKGLNALLRFLSRIEYLLKIGVINESEIEYFQYLAIESIRNPAIIKFAKSDFPLYSKVRERIANEG
jgi:hypothetical protein